MPKKKKTVKKALKKVARKPQNRSAPVREPERELPPPVSGRLADDYYDRIRAESQRFSGGRGDTY